MDGTDDHMENKKLIKPQSVYYCSSTKSIFEYLTEKIPDVLNGSIRENKNDKIEWVKIEDNHTFLNIKNYDKSFIVFIGYSNGLHAWLINHKYEALELISYRNGPVKLAKFLHYIEHASMSERNPILSYVTHSYNSCLYSKIIFSSIKLNEVIHSKDALCEIKAIEANKKFIIVDYDDRLDIIDSKRFVTLLNISRVSNFTLDTICYHDSWLAFSDNKCLIDELSMRNNFVDVDTYNCSSSFLNTAQFLVDKLSYITIPTSANSLFNKKQTQINNSLVQKSNMITIVDLVEGQDFINETNIRTIAHFQAFKDTTVSFMKFSPNGHLLATADNKGRTLCIFCVDPHPLSSIYTMVSHIYALQRGDTEAIINDASFSNDSRWLCFITHRCTVHIFAINPLGGKVSWKTHLNSYCSDMNNVDIDYISTFINFNPDHTFNPLMNQRYFRIKRKPLYMKSINQIKLKSYVGLYENKHSSSCRITSLFSNIFDELSYCQSSNINKKAKYYSHYCNEIFSITDHGVLNLTKIDINFNTEKYDVPLNMKPIEQEDFQITHKYQWSLNRKSDWHDVESYNEATEDCLHLKITTKSFNWIDTIDENTIVSPIRRIWMGPQFKFFTIDQSKISTDNLALKLHLEQEKDVFSIIENNISPILVEE